jgi:hypothetical protein
MDRSVNPSEKMEDVRDDGIILVEIVREIKRLLENDTSPKTWLLFSLSLSLSLRIIVRLFTWLCDAESL